MAIDFFIPKLGDNVDKVTIANWLVDDGAEVKEGEEIVEVETDKAVVPVPANGQGYLHIGPYKAGDEVPIMTVIATISGKAENFAPGKDEAAGAVAKPEETKEAARTESQTPSPPSPEGNGARTAAPEATVETQPKVTPVAQKMAADMGVDLYAIAGSGDRDRITKEDILQAAAPAEPPSPSPTPAVAEIPPSSPQPSSAPTPPKPQPSQAQPDGEVAQRIPLKGIRGIVFKRMPESVHTTARVTLMAEVDATEFVTLREQLKAKFSEEWGFTPGYNDLLGLIAANALRKFPYMNARVSADGEAIEVLKPINIGMAVDTERGLLVTVIRDADTKGLQQFGADFRALVDRARAGKSAPDDLSGGTFTITNLGMYRVDAFTPISNLPEAAILGVGRIVPKPVVKGEEIVARKMMTLSLVFDHRVADGAPAARFLDYICELIEEPYLLFLTTR
ncbi:MAG TPA: dihydrolipoamide acetyltransferase family protein [Anaerolineae bacterium]|nr:dihydrolipoamide acetyltransferase family protein [Anaerolineae bacterium]